MAKARTNIKIGSGPKEKDESKATFAHIKAGDDVPADIAEALPEGSIDREVKGKRGAKKSIVDPEDNESYAGEDAAAESIRNRPDNPDRPSNVEGEDQFKVAKGGSFGLPRGEADLRESKQTPSGEPQKPDSQ
jgi:hypothetical protein